MPMCLVRTWLASNVTFAACRSVNTAETAQCRGQVPAVCPKGMMRQRVSALPMMSSRAVSCRKSRSLNKLRAIASHSRSPLALDHPSPHPPTSQIKQLKSSRARRLLSTQRG